MDIPVRTFRDVASLLPSQRVRHTCITVARQYVALGTSNGTIYVLHRNSGQIAYVLQPEGFEGKEVSGVCFCPFQSHVAIRFADATLPVLVLNIESLTGREKPKVVAKVTDHKGTQVTEFCWDADGRALFTGDASGTVFQTSISRSKLSLKKTDRILADGAPIVQLQHVIVQSETPSVALLIVSTLKRVVVCELAKKEVRPVGTKTRDGPFGAFVSVSSGVLYATRPGFRMWTADWKTGSVLNTLKFAVLTSSDTNPTQPDKNFQFGRLVPCINNKCCLSFVGNEVYVLDLEKINVPFWQSSATFGRLVDACTDGREVYLLHGEDAQPQVSVWQVVTDDVTDMMPSPGVSQSVDENPFLMRDASSSSLSSSFILSSTPLAASGPVSTAASTKAAPPPVPAPTAASAVLPTTVASSSPAVTPTAVSGLSEPATSPEVSLSQSASAADVTDGDALLNGSASKGEQATPAADSAPLMFAMDAQDNAEPTAFDQPSVGDTEVATADVHADSTGISGDASADPVSVTDSSLFFTPSSSVPSSSIPMATSVPTRARSRTARTVDLAAAPVVQVSSTFVPRTLDELRQSPASAITPDAGSSPNTRKQNLGALRERLQKKKKRSTSPAETDSPSSTSDILTDDGHSPMAGSKIDATPVVQEASPVASPPPDDTAELKSEDADKAATTPLTPESGLRSPDDQPTARGVSPTPAMAPIAEAPAKKDSKTKQTSPAEKERMEVDATNNAMLALLQNASSPISEEAASKLHALASRGKATPAVVNAWWSHAAAFYDFPEQQTIAASILADNLTIIDQEMVLAVSQRLLLSRCIHVLASDPDGCLHKLRKDALSAKNPVILFAAAFPRVQPGTVAQMLAVDISALIAMPVDDLHAVTYLPLFISYIAHLVQRQPAVANNSALVTAWLVACIRSGHGLQHVVQCVAQPLRVAVYADVFLQHLEDAGRLEDYLAYVQFTVQSQAERHDRAAVCLARYLVRSSSSFMPERFHELWSTYLLPSFVAKESQAASQAIVRFFRVVSAELRSCALVLADVPHVSTALRVVLCSLFRSLGCECAFATTAALFSESDCDWRPCFSKEYFASLLHDIDLQLGHRAQSLRVLEVLDGYLWSSPDPVLPPQLRMLSEFEFGSRTVPSGSLFDPVDAIANHCRDESSLWTLEDADVHWGTQADVTNEVGLADSGFLLLYADGRVVHEK
jgi:hypothetical protein